MDKNFDKKEHSGIEEYWKYRKSEVTFETLVQLRDILIRQTNMDNYDLNLRLIDDAIDLVWKFWMDEENKKRVKRLPDNYPNCICHYGEVD